MRAPIPSAARRLPFRAASAWATLLVGAVPFVSFLARADVARADCDASPALVDSSWEDADACPIPQPPDWRPGYNSFFVREVMVKPLEHAFDIPDKLLLVARALGAHTRREAVDVNAFDEVPNSTWFTNRNHFRAIPVARMAQGPDSVFLPAKPWTIKHRKHGGDTPGFQIEDASGKKWLVKLDPPGYAQLSSGADMVARTLLHAAGYNVPHNEPVRFRRNDLKIDPGLARGAKGERLTESALDSLLSGGAVFPDGSLSAIASLYLPGHVLGPTSSRRARPGDSNDWYQHMNRRELRGLYVIASWIGFWDTKDEDFLDTFVATGDSVGYVKHYILDAGSSLGAESDGPKPPYRGYEYYFDLGWIMRRFVMLGFAVEPWRRAHQDTGIPSVGNFESAAFEPDKFADWQNPIFDEVTDRDAYWGAKIVASFSDRQIAAAVDAAHYEDARAPACIVRNLIERRDKIARFWFARVAPLDFFVARDETLRFHDLAVDTRLAAARPYEVEIRSEGAGRPVAHSHVHLESAELPLGDLGAGRSRLSLELKIAGSRAAPAHVELLRRQSTWVVTRVRHG